MRFLPKLTESRKGTFFPCNSECIRFKRMNAPQKYQESAKMSSKWPTNRWSIVLCGIRNLSERWSKVPFSTVATQRTICFKRQRHYSSKMTGAFNTRFHYKFKKRFCWHVIVKLKALLFEIHVNISELLLGYWQMEALDIVLVGRRG